MLTRDNLVPFSSLIIAYFDFKLLLITILVHIIQQILSLIYFPNIIQDIVELLTKPNNGDKVHSYHFHNILVAQQYVHLSNQLRILFFAFSIPNPY